MSKNKYNINTFLILFSSQFMKSYKINENRIYYWRRYLTAQNIIGFSYTQ